MAEVHVHGPNGDPRARARATPYTLVPWDEVRKEDEKKVREDDKAKATPSGHEMPVDGWKLTDNNPMTSMFPVAHELTVVLWGAYYYRFSA